MNGWLGVLRTLSGQKSRRRDSGAGCLSGRDKFPDDIEYDFATTVATTGRSISSRHFATFNNPDDFNLIIDRNQH
jgi:hypothetical protein